MGASSSPMHLRSQDLTTYTVTFGTIAAGVFTATAVSGLTGAISIKGALRGDNYDNDALMADVTGDCDQYIEEQAVAFAESMQLTMFVTKSDDPDGKIMTALNTPIPSMKVIKIFRAGSGTKTRTSYHNVGRFSEAGGGKGESLITVALHPGGMPATWA